MTTFTLRVKPMKEVLIGVMTGIFFTLCPVSPKPLLHAKGLFETPPVLSAKEVVPPQLLQGEFHTVQEEVRNDGYLNLYRISSEFGEFEAHGTLMLVIRVKEIQALADENIKRFRLERDA